MFTSEKAVGMAREKVQQAKFEGRKPHCFSGARNVIGRRVDRQPTGFNKPVRIARWLFAAEQPLDVGQAGAFQTIGGAVLYTERPGGLAATREENRYR